MVICKQHGLNLMKQLQQNSYKQCEYISIAKQSNTALTEQHESLSEE